MNPIGFITHDPLAVYEHEVCAVPPLTTAEEAELSRHILANDDQAQSAAVRLVESNLALVISIAHRYQGEGVHVLDLIQAGNEALLLALQTWPDYPGVRFSSHAEALIHAALAQAR